MRDGGTDGLRQLVAQCLDRMETEGATALDAVCAENPDQAEALRRRISALRGMGLVGGVSNAGNEFPERLGEFRLIRPLGGGGMGVVYLAEQDGLNRTVALKLIRPEHLYFPGARERFRREVDAVARLRHPGIVPVYTVGEENGIPYFAMEHVEGRSLAEILAGLKGANAADLSAQDFVRALGGDPDEERGRRSSRSRTAVLHGRWVEACFRIAREVALALQHAHERGVLHRDVKPSNIMLTPEGRVMLLDFGLAVSQGASKLTRSGALIGSLPYMAPEQILGRTNDIGVATDVYGLGATLYELLTLRVPHPGAAVDDMQRAILDGQPEPPSRANAQVPWDAETVCLTALDADVRRRYASAEAFARDLGNVLELRPIEARRPGMVRRSQRFVQRHPALAIAALLGGAILFGAPLAYAMLQRAQRLELGALNEQLEAALADARLQKTQADAGFDKALQAVDLMLMEVGHEDLANVPLMEDVQRRLLQRALGFYQEFLVERGAHEALQKRSANAWFQVGRILNTLGDREGARVHLAQARGLFARLAQRTLAATDRAASVRAGVEIARMSVAEGDLASATTLAGALRAELQDAAGAEAPASLALALCDVLQVEALIAFLRGEDPLAEAALQRGADLALLVAKRSSPAAREAATLAALNCLGELAVRVMRQRDSYPARAADIDAWFAQAIAVADTLPPEAGRAVEVRLVRASLLQSLAGHARRMGRLDEAEAVYLRVLPELDALTAAHPARVALRQELAHVYNNLGLVYELSDRFDQAEAHYQEGLTRLIDLDRAVPGVTDIIANTGIAWMNLAKVGGLKGDPKVEAQRLEHACAWLERAVEKTPQDEELRNTLFNALAGLVAAANAWGDHGTAATAAERAAQARPSTYIHSIKGAIYLARCVRVAEADPALTPEQRVETRQAYARRGVALLRRAVELGFTAYQEVPHHDDFVPFHGTEDFETLLRELGLHE